MKTSNEIRSGFLDFFEAHDHKVVPSYPLVPADDPTLLFTNAGMVQFKEAFLGLKKPPHPRAASSQCCLRVGGKHNDLENVGHTARHHTFFEMLGNFSFGDYFKREAIAYCWEFVVQRLGLPVDRLWVTVYEKDDESAELWAKDTAIPRERILRLGDKDNFWSIGDIGPCGPCTELYYDHGEGVAGDLPGSDDEGDRFTEIWNLVFMQYQKTADGMKPLKTPSVDTGMGLERISAVMQGVHNNFDTDLFQGLIKAAAELAGADDLHSASLKIIADHVRACAFLIADGVYPDNEGRGYVLRRIIRRAARHGRQLGLREPFMYSLVKTLRRTMGEVYPRLDEADARIRKTLTDEEERFAGTLDQGLHLLNERLETMSGGTVPGEVVFKLYDTYGFPADLTADIARERGLEVDMHEFDARMQEQRERARKSGTFAMEGDTLAAGDKATGFSGYERCEDTVKIERLVVGGRATDTVSAGDEVAVILDSTPFYAESGGQIGDTGRLFGDDELVIDVKDTRKQGATHMHYGLVKSGSASVGQTVRARVDAGRRLAIVLNHSATHLLHAALRKALGTHVVQKGSLVADDRLRFDFAHDAPMTRDELDRVECMVNDRIRDNLVAEATYMPKDEAIKSGAMAMFGEKYDDTVRVLSMGDYSVELCGGTHVRRTGDIGLFHIVSEGGVAMGVRRIEAVTGEKARECVRQYRGLLHEMCDTLKAEPDKLAERAGQLVREKAELEKRVEKYQARLLSDDADLSERIVDVDGCAVLAARIDDVDRKALRLAMDRWRERIKSGAIVLAAVNAGKINLIAGVTTDCTGRIHAGELVNAVAGRVGGKGGGRRPDMAEAGGKDVEALNSALEQVPEWVRRHIAS